MDCIHRYLCCNCRRRTVVSRMAPAIMQLLVVVFIWYVFRSSVANQQDKATFLRTPRSNWDEGLPLCSPGDYIRGKSLRLNSIMSSANVLAARQGDQPQFLNVEVIVRDLEQGSLVMYPIGTPVTFGGSNAPEKVKADDEYYMFEGDDERKKGEEYDRIESEGLKATEEKEEEEVLYEEELEYGPGVDKNDHFDVNKDNDFNVDEFDKKRKEEIETSFINLGQYKSPVPTSSNGLHGVANPQGIPGGITEQMPLKIYRSHGLAPSGADALTSYQQSPPSLSSFGQRNFPQDADSKQQAQEGGLGSKNYQQGQQLQPKITDGPKVAEIKDYSFFKSLQGKTADSQQDVKGMSTNTAALNVALDEDGPLYTDGFHERVASFKNEYYGRPVESPSVDSSSMLLLNNPNLCQDSVDILYLVHAQPQSDEQRQGIRTSFVQSRFFRPFKIVHVFLLGRTNSPNFQHKLDTEHEQYGDIIQADFIDKPENATRKGLMGMKWALEYCKTAKFIMKIDEDVFVDSDKLIRGLIPAAKEVVGNRALLCSFVTDAPVPRTGPQAFTHDLFPHSATLRPHCRGFAVLMTRGVLSSLLEASRHAPFVQLEDVYLYGVLPFLAGNIQVYDVGNKRAFHNFGMEVVSCYKNLRANCPFVATKAFSARFTNMWDFVKERMLVPHPGWEGERSLWDIEKMKVKL